VRSSSGCDERLDVLAAEVPATAGIPPSARNAAKSAAPSVQARIVRQDRLAASRLRRQGAAIR
jgi:hypothetical protein